MRFVQIAFLFLALMSAKSYSGVIVHSGGYNGLLAAGYLYENQMIKTFVSYGLTPSSFGEKYISQLNFRVSPKIYQKGPVSFQTGLGLHVNTSERTFYNLPEQYPDNYYPQNKYFFSVSNSVFYKRFFVEVSFLDYYLEVGGRDFEQGYEYFLKSGSLGFGYVF